MKRLSLILGVFGALMISASSFAASVCMVEVGTSPNGFGNVVFCDGSLVSRSGGLDYDIATKNIKTLLDKGYKVVGVTSMSNVTGSDVVWTLIKEQ